MNRNLYALALSLGLLPQLAAQSAPCLAYNDVGTQIYSAIYGGYSYPTAGRVMWFVTPATTTVVQSLTMLLRNQYPTQRGEYLKLEIWTDDPANPGFPGTRLGGGSWKSSTQLVWQGTNLDQPVTMAAGTGYWVMLTEPGWTSVPADPSGTTLFPAKRFYNGTWNQDNNQALRVRFYCGLLDQQGAVPFGPPCASSVGSLGTVFTNEVPLIGNADFRVEGTGFPPGTICFTVLGVIPVFPSVAIPGTPNCFQNTDSFTSLVSTIGVGNVRQATTDGHTYTPFPVPGNVSLTGLYFAAQMAALDPGSTAPLPVVTSNALRVTVQ